MIAKSSSPWVVAVTRKHGFSSQTKSLLRLPLCPQTQTGPQEEKPCWSALCFRTCFYRFDYTPQQKQADKEPCPGSGPVERVRFHISY